MIQTEDDLRLEIQGARCREALRVIGVPETVLVGYPSGPLLFQFAHMAVFLEVEWRLAHSWVQQNKGAIFNYAKGLDEQERPTTSGADAPAN